MPIKIVKKHQHCEISKDDVTILSIVHCSDNPSVIYTMYVSVPSSVCGYWYAHSQPHVRQTVWPTQGAASYGIHRTG